MDYFRRLILLSVCIVSVVHSASGMIDQSGCDENGAQSTVAAEASSRMMVKWLDLDRKASGEPVLLGMGMEFRSDLLGDGLLGLYQVVDGSKGEDKLRQVEAALEGSIQYAELDGVVSIQQGGDESGGMSIVVGMGGDKLM